MSATGNLEQFRIVVAREVSESFRRTSIRILVAIVFLASTAAVTVPDIVTGDDRPNYEIHIASGVSDAVVTRLPDVAADAGADVEMVDAGSLGTSAPRDAVEDGTIDAAVLERPVPLVVTTDDPSDELIQILSQAVSPVVLADRLERAGVDPSRAEDLASTPSVRFESVSAEDDEADRGVAAVAALILYVALFAVAMQVANGTAVEKSSRISEVLLAILRPGTLLFGKVAGVGVVSLAGIGALVAPVLFKAAVSGGLPASALPTVGASVVWFVLGLALWAPLAGMFGAMVERQEEVGTAIQPILIVMVGSYLVATSSPDSPLAAVLGYIPVTSPIVAPSRIAVGASSPVEIAVSIALLVAGAVVAVRVGGAVYRRAIVRTGRRLRLRDVV